MCAGAATPRAASSLLPTNRAYEFKSFTFFSRRIAKGSRLRLLLHSPNSIQSEKNYNSGGVVANESGEDARTAHITLYHDADHASYLEIPIGRSDIR